MKRFGVYAQDVSPAAPFQKNWKKKRYTRDTWRKCRIHLSHLFLPLFNKVLLQDFFWVVFPSIKPWLVLLCLLVCPPRTDHFLYNYLYMYIPTYPLKVYKAEAWVVSHFLKPTQTCFDRRYLTSRWTDCHQPSVATPSCVPYWHNFSLPAFFLPLLTCSTLPPSRRRRYNKLWTCIQNSNICISTLCRYYYAHLCCVYYTDSEPIILKGRCKGKWVVACVTDSPITTCIGFTHTTFHQIESFALPRSPSHDDPHV